LFLLQDGHAEKHTWTLRFLCDDSLPFLIKNNGILLLFGDKINSFLTAIQKRHVDTQVDMLSEEYKKSSINMQLNA
jgi:hypothetical protein